MSVPCQKAKDQVRLLNKSSAVATVHPQQACQNLVIWLTIMSEAKWPTCCTHSFHHIVGRLARMSFEEHCMRWSAKRWSVTHRLCQPLSRWYMANPELLVAVPPVQQHSFSCRGLQILAACWWQHRCSRRYAGQWCSSSSMKVLQ